MVIHHYQMMVFCCWLSQLLAVRGVRHSESCRRREAWKGEISRTQISLLSLCRY
jgi:hypothetical protein